MAENIAEVIPLGPASLTFGGVNLGHTDESGLKLTLKGTLVKAMVAKYGKADVGVFLNGQQAEIDGVMMQSDMTLLAAAFPGATKVTNAGGSSKLTFGVIAGTLLTPATLVVAPYNGPSAYGNVTPTINWTMQAVPVGDFDPVYEGGKVAGYKVKFSGVINEAGAAAGSLVGQFGDSSITANITAPTVSGVVPAQAATGVAVGSTVVWTLSANMNAATVNTNTVSLIKDPAGTPSDVAGSVVLANNGASTTITFTPTVTLTAGKTYVANLAPSVADQTGLVISGGVGFSSRFAT